ncbi:MAG: carboxypeptidase-like regulatory domain-containing protein [Gemmataceae bacterium]
MNATTFLALAYLLGADSPGSTLRGTVVDADGKAVAGARVDLPTAAPRVGTGMFCPSCYRDCAKSARTDAEGRFEFRGLDPALKFRVLVTTPTTKAHLTKLVDPQQGDVRIALEAIAANIPRDRTLLATVVDDRGNPVAGALVDPYGAKTAERRWWGQVDGVDPTVSDAKGNVSIVLPEGFQGLDVKVMIHGYAGATTGLLAPGPQRHSITVPAGTRVTGRLIHNGQPVAGAAVAVVQIDRTAGRHFIKAVGDMTNPDGRFALDALPAGEEYAIFTPVGEGPQPFVLTTKRFKALGDRQNRDLGDLPLIPALRLAGRVDLPAGQPVPAGTKLALGRDPAWDLISVPVNADGSFVADGLPPETYEVRVPVRGFDIDGERMPFQMLERQSFGVRLRESVNDLRIPLVPAAKR